MKRVGGLTMNLKLKKKVKKYEEDARDSPDGFEWFSKLDFKMTTGGRPMELCRRRRGMARQVKRKEKPKRHKFK